MSEKAIEVNTILIGDCLEQLKQLPDESIDCCVTSPPYFGLRDYGDDRQIGLEESPEEYIQRLVSVFREVYRVLKKEGTLWVNIGDTYNSYKGNKNANNFDSLYVGHCNRPARRAHFGLEDKSLKLKDLIGIPWLLAFALRADGWYLRQDIIWNKPNCMPESVKDRCTRSHEYIFLLSKSPRYYFDYEAIQTIAKEEIRKTDNPQFVGGRKRGSLIQVPGDPNHRKSTTRNYTPSGKANKRSVWTISTQRYKDAHFAMFPEKLARECILAGCPAEGLVLDPFLGGGTTAAVAKKLGRNYIGIELNPDYASIAANRLESIPIPLFPF